MLFTAACFAVGVVAGDFVRRLQELEADKQRLREVQQYMDMTKPGAYLEWLSK